MKRYSPKSEFDEAHDDMEENKWKWFFLDFSFLYGEIFLDLGSGKFVENVT